MTTETMPKPTPMTANRRIPPQPGAMSCYWKKYVTPATPMAAESRQTESL